MRGSQSRKRSMSTRPRHRKHTMAIDEEDDRDGGAKRSKRCDAWSLSGLLLPMEICFEIFSWIAPHLVPGSTSMANVLCVCRSWNQLVPPLLSVKIDRLDVARLDTTNVRVFSAVHSMHLTGWSEECPSVVTRALSGFPRLSSLTIECRRGIVPCISTCDSSLVLPNLERVQIVQSVGLSRVESHATRKERPSMCLIESAPCSSTVKYLEFKIVATRQECVRNVDSRVGDCMARFGQSLRSMKSLESLRIVLSTPHGIRMGSNPISASEISRWLSLLSCDSLRRLSIRHEATTCNPYDGWMHDVKTKHDAETCRGDKCPTRELDHGLRDLHHYHHHHHHDDEDADNKHWTRKDCMPICGVENAWKIFRSEGVSFLIRMDMDLGCCRSMKADAELPCISSAHTAKDMVISARRPTRAECLRSLRLRCECASSLRFLTLPGTRFERLVKLSIKVNSCAASRCLLHDSDAMHYVLNAVSSPAVFPCLSSLDLTLTGTCSFSFDSTTATTVADRMKPLERMRHHLTTFRLNVEDDIGTRMPPFETWEHEAFRKHATEKLRWYGKVLKSVSLFRLERFVCVLPGVQMDPVGFATEIDSVRSGHPHRVLAVEFFPSPSCLDFDTLPLAREIEQKGIGTCRRYDWRCKPCTYHAREGKRDDPAQWIEDRQCGTGTVITVHRYPDDDRLCL